MRFIALNVAGACTVDDDSATADGYVTALEAAARGLEDATCSCSAWARSAARQHVAGVPGARVVVAEPDEERGRRRGRSASRSRRPASPTGWRAAT